MTLPVALIAVGLVLALALALALWDLGRRALKIRQTATNSISDLRAYLEAREARLDNITKNFIIEMKDVVKALAERQTQEKQALLKSAQSGRVRFPER